MKPDRSDAMVGAIERVSAIARGTTVVAE